MDPYVINNNNIPTSNSGTESMINRTLVMGHRLCIPTSLGFPQCSHYCSGLQKVHGLGHNCANPRHFSRHLGNVLICCLLCLSMHASSLLISSLMSFQFFSRITNKERVLINLGEEAPCRPIQKNTTGPILSCFMCCRSICFLDIFVVYPLFRLDHMIPLIFSLQERTENRYTS